MLDRISCLTYGSALAAAAGVLTYYYDHPAVAAISAAATVVGGMSAFREIANSLTNTIKSATTQIGTKIESETNDLHNTIEAQSGALELRLPYAIDRYSAGERPLSMPNATPSDELTPTG
jgi:hypothetical protein